MSSCRRSQAQGTHPRDDPKDPEAAPWRDSQRSGSESLELSGRPVQGPSILLVHQYHGDQPT